MENQRPPLPPFTEETAKQKIQMAEDAWNSKDPDRVSKAYTVDSEWRNRHLFINGREEIVQFLTAKWQKEQQYKLKKEYWAHTGNRIAVRSSMSTTTKTASGGVPTATKIGSLMKMA